jgi:hypothetical protein
MFGRQISIRDRRKASIRKFAAGRKERISADGRAGDPVFMISLCACRSSCIDRLLASAAKRPRRIAKGRRVMADIVYVVIGLLFFALMGVYAVACDRL